MSNITLIFAESLKQNNMCWRPYNEKDTVAKKAKRAIIAYKVMHKRNDDEVESYYMNSCYTINKETTLGEKITLNECGAIGYGFHSYSENCHITRARIYFYLIVYGIDKQTIITTYPNHYNIVQCIIPKGSTYYENEKGEIVSDKIRITDNIFHLNDALPIDEYKPFKNLKFKK